jgi:hypothetical protein
MKKNTHFTLLMLLLCIGCGTAFAQTVNKNTGDLSLQQTAVSIPGPQGGYSIPLSYQARVSPLQPSSWLGMGWNMQAGAIGRSTVQHPDDWNGKTMESFSKLPVDDEAWEFFNAYSRGASSGGLSWFYFPWNQAYNGIQSNNGNNYFFSQEVETAYGSLYTKNGYDDILISHYPDTRVQRPNKSLDALSNPFYPADSAYSPEAKNNLTSPGYDQFSVYTSGVKGLFSPRFNRDVVLPKKGSDRYNVSMNPALWFLHSTESLFYINLENPSGQSNAGIDLQLDLEPEDINFQFDNETGGYYLQSPGTWSHQSPTPAGTPNYNDHVPWNDISYQEIPAQYPVNFHNTSENKRGTAMPIEWFTNEELLNGSARLNSSSYMDYGPAQQERIDYDPDGIGGFVITSTGGVRYHFGLPVYVYEEINGMESTVNANDFFSVQAKLDPYAVQWLLTAVTGPDFEDVNANGLVDDADKGYWVKFNYGKWSNGFVWCNPHGGHNPLKLKDAGAYSMGRRDAYYLNSAETSTHIAYFVKALKDDETDGLDGLLSLYYTEGGKYFDMDYVRNGHTRSLRLKEIVLARKDELNLQANMGGDLLPKVHGTFDFTTQKWLKDDYHYWPFVANQYQNSYTRTVPTRSFSSHLADNVLDEQDIAYAINNGLQPYAHALQVIKFEQDYSLFTNSPGTVTTGQNSQSGRLTLKKIITRGKGNAQVLPSQEFEYYPSDFDAKGLDTWGYACAAVNPANPGGHNPLLTADGRLAQYADFIDKPLAKGGSLKKIISPMGGETEIMYESDSYERKAVFGKNTHRLRAEEVDLVDMPGDPTDDDINIHIPTADVRFGFLSAPNIKIGLILQKVSGVNPVFTFELDTIYYNQYSLTNIGNETTTLTLPSKWTHPSSNGFPDELVGAFLNVEGYTGYGGGLRVTAIHRIDDQGKVYKTKFDYSDPLTGKSSGYTSYAPKRQSNRFIPFVNELPGPAVHYEYCTITNESAANNESGKIRLQFEVMADPSAYKPETLGKVWSLGDQFEVRLTQKDDIQHNDLNDPYNGHPCTYCMHKWESYVHFRTAEIHDRTARLGRLLKQESFTPEGLLASTTRYEYDDDWGSWPNVQGVKQDLIHDSKIFLNVNWLARLEPSTGDTLEDWWEKVNLNITSTMKSEYPNFLKRSTTIAGGKEQYISYSDFDIFMGSPKVAISYNGDGRYTRTSSQAAHTLPQYAQMGPQIMNPNHANAMSAGYYTKTETSTDGINWQPVDASATTFTNQRKIRRWNGTAFADQTQSNPALWRAEDQFYWRGFSEKDGTLKSDFADHDFGTTALNNNWRPTGQTSLYNTNNLPLETRDINGNYGSRKYGYGQDERPLSVAINARYKEAAFTSMEDINSEAPGYFGGEVLKGPNAIVVLTSH